MAATQQVTSSNQPSGGSCGSTRLIKHSLCQIEVLWALAKWFGKDTDPFAKLSLETTHFKSIIGQLYTEGLADLETIQSVIYRQVFQIFAQKMRLLLGFQGIYGEMNVSGNSVKCKKDIFGLLEVIYVWVWLAVFQSWALLLEGRLLSSGSDRMGPCHSNCSCSSEVFHPEVGLGGSSLFLKLDIHSAVFGARSHYIVLGLTPGIDVSD